MDAEQAIAEIEWLEHIFALPDTRPLQLSDLSAANRRHDDRTVRGFGCGSGMASDPREKIHPMGLNDEIAALGQFLRSIYTSRLIGTNAVDFLEARF